MLKNKIKPIFLAAAILICSSYLIVSTAEAARVVYKNGKTYIKDRRGELWDVTRAKQLGFSPHGFQYGIGRHAIPPLDGTSLKQSGHFKTKDNRAIKNIRVIGVTDGEESHAYSVRKLRRHEIANTQLGEEAIAVGY